MFKVPERSRVKIGPLGTTEADGNNGLFKLRPFSKGAPSLTVIASDGEGWEHVSVSTYKRCPTWDEMSHVKDTFWGAQDLVIQYHPPESEYVNCHPFCLHLWRKAGTNNYAEVPEKILVGP